MRFRVWLRDQVVNRESDLGPVRMALLRFLDPMEWYMRKGDIGSVGISRRARGGKHVGRTSYGPLEDETPADGVSRGARAPESRAEDEPSAPERHRQLQVEYGSLLDAKARDLLAGNVAVVETTGGTIRARLVRFRSGAVIESWSKSSGGTGHAIMRMEQEGLGDWHSHLTSFLAWQVVNLGPDARALG